MVREVVRLLAVVLGIATVYVPAQTQGGPADGKPADSKAPLIRPIEIKTSDSKADEPKAGGSKADYSKEAFVIENDISKLTFENDGTSVRESTSRILIQSDAGVQHYSVLTLPYQKSEETVEIEYVRVVKPDGSVVPTPLDDVQDMPSEITRQAPFYSDAREKHIAVKGLSPGDVLEMQERWRTTNPLIPGQFWFAYQFSHDAVVLHEEVQISIPKTRAVRWKSPDFKPTISEQGDRQIFTWTRSQLETQSQEEAKKSQEEKLYEMGRGILPAPDMMMSTFQNWEEVGNWYNKLQKERVKPTDEIRAKAAELTKNAADDNAKLRAIYHYVSTQFHYIGVAFGIGRYQPHFAAEVMDNQYGDCKDKHTLLASLLEAAGIQAEPALINSIHKIDPDVPSPAQFDHVITAVQQGNKLIWLDTTSEVAPYGYLLSMLRDKQALLMPPDKPPSLVTTPADPLERPMESFVMNATLAEDGTLEGKASREESNSDVEIVLRAAFRGMPMTQWQELVQRVSYSTGFAGEVSGVTASPPEKTQEPFRISYSYNRKDFPDWANRRVATAVPPFGLPGYDPKPAHLIWLGSPEEFHYESHLKLPKGYSPQLPANIDLKEDFAEYHSAYSTADGVLSVDRRLVVKLREVPDSEFEAYKKFNKAVADEYVEYVSVSSPSEIGTPPSPETLQSEIQSLPPSGDAGAMREFNEAGIELRNGEMQEATHSLEEAVAADPHFVRAWLMLSSLHAAAGQKGMAIETLRKASAANPADPVIYKMLFWGLREEHKDDDLVALLREHLKSSPEDVTALSQLASTLSDQKKYSDAISTLETAVKIAPDRAGLYGQLGYAYMKSGDDDKALDAYKKDLSLDASPNMYNDIAYNLALDNKFLPTALEYAQKSVKAEADLSGKVTLQNLRLDDVNHTANLSANWDTLGWVYFKMGNMNQAEKYVRASWALSQQAEVGDHLGQIYEQQHDSKKALHMYRLALASAPNATRMADAMKEIREHIQRVGGDPNSSLSVEVDELNRARTFRVTKTQAGTNVAEFFVLLGPDGKTDDSLYISGSETLKPAGKELASVDFKPVYPDSDPVRLVRRGILSCYPQTGCSFVLLNPYDVHSIQ
jgi:tetratricopeptide (TPR) repeat protein